MNESPGYRPEWISHHGEVLPADAQAVLRDNSEAQRLLRDAGIDLDRLGDEMIRTAAEFNSVARMAEEAT